MPVGETGRRSGHLIASSPQGVAPNPQDYNPLPEPCRPDQSASELQGSPTKEEGVVGLPNWDDGQACRRDEMPTNKGNLDAKK
jgi:hypothetical protein